MSASRWIWSWLPMGALALWSAGTVAQQDPLYSQYMFNTLAFNPGYAGHADVISLMGTTRHQWVGFDGAPSTQTLTAQSPLRKESLALGFQLIHDKTGPARQTGAYVDLAYRIKTGEDTRLAFGLSGGANLFQADLASLSTVETDPSNLNVDGQWLPNFGFGLFWWGPRCYLGLSAPKLLTNEIRADASVITTSEEVRHYFLLGGYVFSLSRDLKFKPSFMVRAVEGAPFSVDLNASFLLRERIWLGALYRIGNSIGLQMQYQITEQLRLGYAYDLTTTSLRDHNSGTHEVMLGYDLRFTKGRAISPRYF